MREQDEQWRQVLARRHAGVLGERIEYALVPMPAELGVALLAATARGLCAMLLGDDAGALRAELQARFPSALIAESARVSELYHAALFSALGQPIGETELPLDVRATAFQARIWAALRAIPRGETRTYAQVAASVGSPKAVRAVARACAANPVALLVPCHRVLGSDGSLTGYRWGVERKRALLEFEKRDSPVTSGGGGSQVSSEAETASHRARSDRPR